MSVAVMKESFSRHAYRRLTVNPSSPMQILTKTSAANVLTSSALIIAFSVGQAGIILSRGLGTAPR